MILHIKQGQDVNPTPFIVCVDCFCIDYLAILIYLITTFLVVPSAILMMLMPFCKLLIFTPLIVQMPSAAFTAGRFSIFSMPVATPPVPFLEIPKTVIILTCLQWLPFFIAFKMRQDVVRNLVVFIYNIIPKKSASITASRLHFSLIYSNSVVTDLLSNNQLKRILKT